MSTRIELSRDSRSWLATFSVDGAPEPDVLELFGTATLPTAFRSDAPASVVIQALRKRNPGAVVVLCALELDRFGAG